MWVCIYSTVVCNSWGFWCFSPFAATDFSQRQLTFASEAKMVEVERTSKLLFSGSPYAHRQCWKQYHGSLFPGKGPASNHFPTGQPLGCLGTSLSGAKTASPLCTHQEKQEAGTASFSSNRIGDHSAPALQRDSWGLLWSLAAPIFPFCSPLVTSRCPPRSRMLTVMMAPSMPWHEGKWTKAKLIEKTNKERGIREKIA